MLKFFHQLQVIRRRIRLRFALLSEKNMLNVIKVKAIKTG